MSHSVFTVIAVVKEGRDQALENVLAGVNGNPPFRQLRGGPFASFTIFPTPRQLQKLPAFKESIVVFESNIDGAGRRCRERYLTDLLNVGTDIDDIYEHCVDWPGRNAPREKKLGYLLKKVRKPHLYHVGTPHRAA